MASLATALRATVSGALLMFSGALSALQACEIDGEQPASTRLLRLTEHGDITLSDGSLARLSGIRPLQPEPGVPDPQAARLEAIIGPWREQGRIMIASEAKQDRWGRVPVRVVLTNANLSGSVSGGVSGSLAYGLVRSGFAMAWASELPPNCRNLFFQAEDVARRSSSGRWTQMQHKPLDAANGADVASRAGRITLMSGRVNHVGQTRRATYLNFGARGTGASAEVGLSTWRLLEGQGWTRENLKGKMVRVRGVVMEGRPARLMLGDASAIEFLN